MTTNYPTAESECRWFAAHYPTPHVLEAIAYCESGRLDWEQVRQLFARSIRAGLDLVDTLEATS